MPQNFLQAERDNKSVYFQHNPAADTLVQIQPRRLVTATAYIIPAPADLVNEALMDSFAGVPPDEVRPLLPEAGAALLGSCDLSTMHVVPC